ncbi:MAG: prolipoprotein diacylglyceryl transferase [Candidatus Omnitrophica bacterium CG08_land_8_20_14_0_20_41_16]|uniref:Phosphatidylglycerol--prolipoprotein diacylglyceryl transferase n=1 Tax=Candidatus Sherwoodlollariibacterium unditelluris TaxID=1974757 RepID=A0A2G9YJF8_9BACT|nr:MAG: prolipoprotein diacylglyceryl transferase [Candidatus Omnitrophica bacterium CG23_combo_of_CG06-09_8_20_14_all_41_10]PIS33628.1 MAG: prolipoprotein diacylglyceryl transferase [Candidatus Omnitrophica bacterium CG08_land_8_20_14_0_20_41_16]
MSEFINWWNHFPEHISPVAFRIGPVQAHYYGLMYLVAFLTVYLLVLSRLKKENTGFSKEVIDNYFLWAILAVLIGGRVGYALFYNLAYYINHPLEVILPFDINNGYRYIGLYGMSYHGALIGIIAASVIFCHKFKLNFWLLADLFAPAVPLGYTFGRLGNFINGELYGRVTSVPWGMYFPLDPMRQLRHPSQLYEALFEGVFLFIILWSLRKRVRISGVLFSLYLIGYGLVRLFLEFFREPDQQLGFILGPLTMGQVLCFMMILFGGIVIVIRISKVKKQLLI